MFIIIPPRNQYKCCTSPWYRLLLTLSDKFYVAVIAFAAASAPSVPSLNTPSYSILHLLKLGGENLLNSTYRLLLCPYILYMMSYTPSHLLPLPSPLGVELLGVSPNHDLKLLTFSSFGQSLKFYTPSLNKGCWS